MNLLHGRWAVEPSVATVIHKGRMPVAKKIISEKCLLLKPFYQCSTNYF